eukprot:jgi/Chlat1/3988/Chrsp26S03981
MKRRFKGGGGRGEGGGAGRGGCVRGGGGGRERDESGRVLPHPRSRYADKAPDFAALAELYPSFKPYVRIREDGSVSIDWTSFDATRELTCALLHHDYKVDWVLPDGYLCPTVTSRENYINWIHDLLQLSRRGHASPPDKQPDITGIDIGTGASCIYPLIGASIFGWHFVGTDIVDPALQHAKANVDRNPHLAHLIQVRRGHVLESQGGDIDGDGAKGLLVGVVNDDERYDFCMCNPPFFESFEEVGANPRTACGGSPAEMVTPGGEAAFVRRIIADSFVLRDRVWWYTSMLGRKATLLQLKKELHERKVPAVRVTEFSQGRTARWGLAWSFAPDVAADIQKSITSHTQPRANHVFSVDKYSAADLLSTLRHLLTEEQANFKQDGSAFSFSGTLVMHKSSDSAVQGKRARSNEVGRSTSSPPALSGVPFSISVFQQAPGAFAVKTGIGRLSPESSAAALHNFDAFARRIQKGLLLDRS